MNSKQILLHWMHTILMDIRYEASANGDIKKIALLSNIFRNVPLELSESNEVNDELLKNLKLNLLEHHKDILNWLEKTLPKS